jgi:hypothetical protein
MDPRLGGLSSAAACWRFVAPTPRGVGIFLRAHLPRRGKAKAVECRSYPFADIRLDANVPRMLGEWEGGRSTLQPPSTSTD